MVGIAAGENTWARHHQGQSLNCQGTPCSYLSGMGVGSDDYRIDCPSTTLRRSAFQALQGSKDEHTCLSCHHLQRGSGLWSRCSASHQVLCNNPAGRAYIGNTQYSFGADKSQCQPAGSIQTGRFSGLASLSSYRIAAHNAAKFTSGEVHCSQPRLYIHCKPAAQVLAASIQAN